VAGRRRDRAGRLRAAGARLPRQAAAGAVPKSSAVAIVSAAFPSLTQQQIEAIFEDVVSGSLTPEEVVQRAVLMLQKKKCCEVKMSADRKDLSDEEYELIVSRLKDRGEIIDPDEWELISDEEACGDHAAELEAVSKIELETLASLNSYANGDEKSPWGDSGLYKLRYAYSQNLSDGSRQFCVDMVALSKAGMVFRYEDIQAMGDEGVNGQFAPEGQSTYDIFTWKGGVYCHHFWKRQIYFRKREGGKFLPNKGLENDKRVGNVPFVPQKGEEGIAPINTPTRGSLKNP